MLSVATAGNPSGSLLLGFTSWFFWFPDVVPGSTGTPGSATGFCAPKEARTHLVAWMARGDKNRWRANGHFWGPNKG